MDLPNKVESLLKIDNEGYLCSSGKDYANQTKPLQQKEALKTLESILDTMGGLSAKAQALKQIITNSMKFTGTDHRIYIKIQGNKALGFLKVG